MAMIYVYVPDPIPAKEITFSHDEGIHKAMARPFDTSFYIITEGKWKGNLVHVCDIIRK